MKYAIALIFSLLCGSVALAQFKEHPEPTEARNKGNGILAHLLFGGHLPGGDLQERFGPAFSAGLGGEWLTEGNFILGVEGHFFYGNEVKEDPLAIIRTAEGGIIGNDRQFASVVLRQRGTYAGGYVGKLFTFGEKRSGIRLTLGGGWAQSKIRVQDDNNTVTQLFGDYKKGYDRLTGGIGLQQFVGWQHLGRNRRANWIIGIELSQAFTNTLRDWDFNEMRKLDMARKDLRIGLRAAWTIPFYVGNSADIYY